MEALGGFCCEKAIQLGASKAKIIKASFKIKERLLDLEYAREKNRGIFREDQGKICYGRDYRTSLGGGLS